MTEPLRDVLRDVLHPWCKGTVDEVIAALAQQGVTLTREPGLDVERLVAHLRRMVREDTTSQSWRHGVEYAIDCIVAAALASEDRP